MAKQQMISAAASSSTSSSSVESLKRYDVFLSFRGEDTRSNFTSHLHGALSQKKVETYIDYRLEKGDEISPALIKAIEDSHASLVIFSENYASSKWCLDELSKIVECKKDQGHIVIPVFYNIDPSHVRKQTGSYKQALAKHEQDLKGNKDKVHKWKDALTEAANLAGWDSRTYRTEAKLIGQIVDHVLKRLKHIHMRQNNPKGVVGIQEEIAFLESLAVLESEDVLIIGIWGMGGIGKTTIAKELYDRLRHEYEACCFVPNVREKLEKCEVTDLQNKIVGALLEEKDRSTGILIVDCEYNMVRLRRKKVLLVLDDVDDLRKLENLYGGRDWFGQGSRIIVTSRDKQVLTNLVDYIYEVKALKFEDSLKLFSWNAFKENYPKLKWMDLSVRAVNYAKGIPLAIKVLGSSLYGEEKEVWESQLQKLKKMPLPEIRNVLKLSYDGLDREEQDIFLYIACFFGYCYGNIFLLDDCGYSTKVGLTKLCNKALIHVDDALHKKWKMHDLIRDMGKEIVRGEFEDPGKRRHLWDPYDVYQVLENATGTRAIQSLTLENESKELHLSPKAFNGMFNLKFLVLKTYDVMSQKGKMFAPKGLESMPDGLRLLYWVGCPLKSMPLSFCAENLVELDLSFSSLEKLWNGVQNLVKLKEFSLQGCEQVMELPDFSKALNLEYVDLSDCTHLCDLHPSILSLHNLETLYLCGCKNLKSLQSDHHLKSLSVINARGCSSLKEFSVMSESMDELDLTDTGIVEMHSLGLPLNKLEHLNYGFSESLPHSFLQVLNLWDLRKSILDFFAPSYFLQCLKDLSLSESNVESLPTSIKHLSVLKKLVLSDCKRLRFIPELPPCIDMLDVSSCISLEEVSISTTDHCWHSEVYFLFRNCWRLNQQTLNTIMSDAHVKMKGAAYIQHLQPYECSRKNKTIGVCLPGSKVPADRYDYSTTTEATMTIRLSNLSNLMGLSFCVVFSRCQFTTESLFYIANFNCSLQTSNAQEDKFTVKFGPLYIPADIQHDSDHLFLWHNEEFSKSITDKIKERSTENQCTTYDPELSFTIFPVEQIKIKEWGIYPIYASELFSFSDQLELDAKTKRYKDTDKLLDKEALPPRKKLKTK